jgi:hypothetical protein
MALEFSKTGSTSPIVIDKKTGRVSVVLDATMSSFVEDKNYAKTVLNANVKTLKAMKAELMQKYPELKEHSFDNVQFIVPHSDGGHFKVTDFKVNVNKSEALPKLHNATVYDSLKLGQQYDPFSCGV